MIDVVAVGEILMDLIATSKDVALFDAPSFAPLPGGAPANVAVGVRRLGKSSAFIGKVGCDNFGVGLRNLLRTEGVDVRGLLDDPQHFTTLAFAVLSAMGEPQFDFFVGAHAHLQIADIDSSLLREARIVHGGSVTLTQEPSRSATFAAWQIGHDAGAICTYDVNWRPRLWPDVTEGVLIVKQPLQLVDIVKMNAAELTLLTGQKDMRLGLQELNTTAALVVVTQGSQGCLYRFQGALYEQKAPPATQVIDTTGAGDALMAALLAGLPAHLAQLDAETVASIVKRACQAGTYSVARAGAIPSLPYAHELL